jgi:hypothetical protein
MAKAFNPFNDTICVLIHTKKMEPSRPYQNQNSPVEDILNVTFDSYQKTKSHFVTFLEEMNKSYELPKYTTDQEYSPSTSKTIDSLIKIMKDDKSIKKNFDSEKDNAREYFINAPDIV